MNILKKYLELYFFCRERPRRGLFLLKKLHFPVLCRAAGFSFEKLNFLRVRPAAGVFLMKNYILSSSGLPQAPFFAERCIFFVCRLAACAFFAEKHVFLFVFQACRRLFLLKHDVFACGTCRRRLFWVTIYFGENILNI